MTHWSAEGRPILIWGDRISRRPDWLQTLCVSSPASVPGVLGSQACTRKPEFQYDFLTSARPGGRGESCYSFQSQEKGGLLPTSKITVNASTLHPGKLREEHNSFHLGNVAICSVFYKIAIVLWVLDMRVCVFVSAETGG